jgi:uncharacterized protein (DUF362 family)
LNFSRRKFITLIGFLGVGVTLGSIFASLKLRVSIPPIKKTGDRSKVFIIGSENRQTGIKKLMENFSIDRYKGENVAIKANFNSDDPFPASTHIDSLRTVVEELKRFQVAEINLAERSGMGNTRKVLENTGVFDLAKSIGFNVIVLDELHKEDWIKIPPDGIHWLKGFQIAKIFKNSSRIVQICCLKTHRFGGHFTMSLKNSVGMIAKRPPADIYNYMLELHASPFQRSMIAEINRFYDIDLIIMDASKAFIKDGPDRGVMVKPGVILASTDRVAIDAVGVAILRAYNSTKEVMNGKIFKLEQLRRAAELGVGIDSADKIDLIPLNDSCQDITEKAISILQTEG